MRSLAERTWVDVKKIMSSEEGRSIVAPSLIFSGTIVFPSVTIYFHEAGAIWFPFQDISVSSVEKGHKDLEKRTTVVSPCRRIEHLGLNVVLQLLVGIPLEMVHGAARISFVYVAGVVAGRWHLWMPQMEKHLKMVCADFCIVEMFCDIWM